MIMLVWPARMDTESSPRKSPLAGLERADQLQQPGRVHTQPGPVRAGGGGAPRAAAAAAEGLQPGGVLAPAGRGGGGRAGGGGGHGASGAAILHGGGRLPGAICLIWFCRWPEKPWGACGKENILVGGRGGGGWAPHHGGGRLPGMEALPH